MATSIAIDEAVDPAYKRINTRKSRAIILKIEGKPEKIVLEKEITKEEFNHEEFLKLLPDNEPRYAILDYEYTTGDGIISDQIFFILYIPLTCKPNLKFVYASGRGSIEGTYSSISKTIQVSDVNDLSEEKLRAKIK